MNKQTQLFTPESEYAVIRVMFQAIGMNIQAAMPKPTKPVVVNKDHITLMVARSGREPPHLIFMTKNSNTYLMVVRFEGADTYLSILPDRNIPRTRIATGEMANDASLIDAMILYADMKPVADAYIQSALRMASLGEAVGLMQRPLILNGE